jgi:hypothetical protein
MIEDFIKKRGKRGGSRRVSKGADSHSSENRVLRVSAPALTLGFPPRAPRQKKFFTQK